MLAIFLLVGAKVSNATTISFTDVDLGSGNPVSVGGVTLTTSTVGGGIGLIPSGSFSGLHLGNDDSSGSYTLAFSLAISSIEIEFDALTDFGVPPAETIFNFSNSNGAVSIG
jgi:hypothetical protein